MVDTPAKVDLKSMSITDEQKARLKQLFPQVFNEDKIDFDKLRRTLGEEIDEGEERFGMTWPGKNECFRVIQEPSIATLKPVKKESIGWDNSENLFIEGDNLEVLKLLQRSYYGKIKMIYIDPPYNTGKEFVYPDKYSESLETYLAYTGQLDANGVKFSTNTETEGRFHSKWLNMMYPRLFLARNLLAEDGVIFISIDDNEVKNLHAMMDDIFGEENIIGSITIQSNPRGRQSDTHLASVHDYLLCYAKNLNMAKINGIPLSKEQKKEFKYKDESGAFYRLLGLRQRGSASKREDRPDMFFPIYVNANTLEISLQESGTEYTPIYPRKSDGTDGRWMWGKEKVTKDIHLLVAKLIERRNEYDIFVKDYLDKNGKERTRKYKTIWDSKLFNNQAGTQEVKQLIESDAMSFPKSKDLIKEICRMGSNDGDIVLDFFAGSGTTAHAVIDFNYDESENRKFIMIQLPELTGRDDFVTIADIGKERIRKVIKKIEKGQAAKEKDAENKLPGMTEEKTGLNLGFKVFKLDKSNFNIWDGTVDENGDVLGQIEMFIDHIDPDSSDEDILFEILLKSGFELTTKIEELDLAGKKVYSIADNALLICLDRKLTKEVITEMTRLQPARVVCLDAGFADNDQLKTNAVQIMKSHDVEDFRTV